MKTTALFAVGVAIWCFVVVFVGVKFTAEKTPAQSNPHVNVTSPTEPPSQPVDLSTMTPREAADRLFNRVMAANESGNAAEAMQFAPMALQAYELVDPLDADARYHIGLISLVTGDLDNAREQIEILQRESADHLLALILLFKVAEKSGNEKMASQARIRFARAYDAQMSSGRPEYEAHRVTIETFHASTMGSNTTER